MPDTEIALNFAVELRLTFTVADEAEKAELEQALNESFNDMADGAETTINLFEMPGVLRNGDAEIELLEENEVDEDASW